jgi:hypothetical protein
MITGPTRLNQSKSRPAAKQRGYILSADVWAISLFNRTEITSPTRRNQSETQLAAKQLHHILSADVWAISLFNRTEINSPTRRNQNLSGDKCRLLTIIPVNVSAILSLV